MYIGRIDNGEQHTHRHRDAVREKSDERVEPVEVDDLAVHDCHTHCVEGETVVDGPYEVLVHRNHVRRVRVLR